jgi:hypothetical protein
MAFAIELPKSLVVLGGTPPVGFMVAVGATVMGVWERV